MRSKRTRVLASLVLLGMAASLEAASPKGESAGLYEFVALLPEPTTDAEPLEMQESIEAWADYMRVTGVGEFHAHFFDRIAEAEAFIRKRRQEGRAPSFGVIPNLVAHTRADDWGFTPLLCPVYGGSKLQRYQVVALRAEKAASVADLKGRRLATVAMWGEVPDLLGRLLFRDGRKPQGFFETVITTGSQRECLVAVLRRQAEAALVTAPFFEVAQKRNRRLWSDFKVLEDLPPLHIHPFVAFREAPQALVQTVKTLMLDSRGSDAGRHVLELFHIDGFEPCTRDEFAEMEGKMLGAGMSR